MRLEASRSARSGRDPRRSCGRTARGGGTCFGDSAGPNSFGDGEDLVVAGVTSFGINGNCAGTGGVFRVDRQNVQDFINDFIDDPYTVAP